jgi:hypothetical protein
MKTIVCERCGQRWQDLKGTAWPVIHRGCGGRAAPSWWFSEHNPDRTPKSAGIAPSAAPSQEP